VKVELEPQDSLPSVRPVDIELVDHVEVDRIINIDLARMSDWSPQNSRSASRNCCLCGYKSLAWTIRA
jgi:hypothetical protein